MKLYSLVSRLRGISHRRARVTVISSLLIVLAIMSVTSFSPIKTVKGLLTDTGVSPSSNNNVLFIDSGKVTYISSIAPSSAVGVYDIASGSGTTFSTANASQATLYPGISGDKVLDALSPSINTPVTLYYCKLPHASPIQPCGPWTSIVTGLPSIATLAFLTSFPEITGDLVVWVNSSSFGFYRFSTGQITTVTTTTQPFGLTSNGAIIVFAAKPTSTSSSETIRYYDTSLPPASRTIVDTGFPGYNPTIAIGQNTIAFVDNSTTTDRLRYYDIARNQASSTGTGPLGFLSYVNHPNVWGNRILFQVDEVTDNFDCDGDGLIQSSQSCLGLWNIRGPTWVATTIVASAAPAVKSAPVISDGIVVFVGSNGHIQYVTVPMQGDVDQDGVTDGVDKTLVDNCVGKVLKGSVC